MLTLWELVGSVDVVTPNNNDGKLEASHIRIHKHLGGSLARGVRVGRSKNARLEEIIVVVLDLSIDLVGRDVNEALDANLLGTLEQHVGAVDVGVSKAVRVAKAQVDVRLGGKVEDGVDVVALEAVDHLDGVGDVALVEAKVALLVEGACVVERGAVVELVERDDIVGVGIREGEVSHKPRSAVKLGVSIGAWGLRCGLVLT
jgi:hypothetical protein